MFYFQQLLNTALAGIDGTAIISTVTTFAFAILLIGFLIGLYQAAFRGGDLQALAGTAVKYLVVAMIVSNWATVFRGVNGSFNAVANFIGSSSGAGDMFQSWMGQLQQQFANNPSLTLTDIITGDAAATITVVLLVVAYLLYALAMIVFCFFYTLFGAVLYVVGPLVLALIPISGVGQLGKSYAVNVMIWNAWGILYAVFGALITAIQVNQVNNILGNGFLGFLKRDGRLGHAWAGQHLLCPGHRANSLHCQTDHLGRCRVNSVCAGESRRGCGRRRSCWSHWLCGRSESGFCGRYSVGWRGRFVHLYCPGVVNTAACSLDAGVHPFGSCERDEQQ